MIIDGLRKLKEKIKQEITEQHKLIQSLEKTSKPVAPDNAIGRLTRMKQLIAKLLVRPPLSLQTPKSKS